MRSHDKSGEQIEASAKAEWLSFLFVTLILLPGLAVATVGGYGFFVWIIHIIYGPPVS